MLINHSSTTCYPQYQPKGRLGMDGHKLTNFNGLCIQCLGLGVHSFLLLRIISPFINNPAQINWLTLAKELKLTRFWHTNQILKWNNSHSHNATLILLQRGQLYIDVLWYVFYAWSHVSFVTWSAIVYIIYIYIFIQSSVKVDRLYKRYGIYRAIGQTVLDSLRQNIDMCIEPKCHWK